jgi:uncharacterized protein (TIGR03067 family)
MIPRIVAVLLVAALALAASSPAEAGAEKALAALQGTWTLVSLESDGEVQEFPDRPPRWVIKGKDVRYAGQPLAALAIDPTTTPRNIDLTFRNPKRVYEGVYAVDGDTLKVCVNRLTEGVKERPLGFATRGKRDWRLLIFKRDKAGAGDGVEGLPGFVGMALQGGGKELLVSQVLDGSPAKKAGLKKDDVLLQVGATEATDLRTAVEAVRRARPGSQLTLRVRRGGEERDLTVRVGVLPFHLLD